MNYLVSTKECLVLWIQNTQFVIGKKSLSQFSTPKKRGIQQNNVTHNDTSNKLNNYRHNDLPWNVRKFLRNQINEFDLDTDLTRVEPWSISKYSHTDLPRLREGMVGAQVSTIHPIIKALSIGDHNFRKFSIVGTPKVTPRRKCARPNEMH